MNSNMKVITISGKAEHGKDTAAKSIKNRLESMGYSVLICHYADLLKYICKQFFSWDGKKDEEGRSLLQIVGTETIRKKEPEFWVDFIAKILELFPDEWDFVLIPDTRFPNEIDSMKKKFGTVSVRVVRPNFENHLTEEQRKHESETALDKYKFDYEIINPGTDELETEVEMFVNEIFQHEIKKSLKDVIKEKL